MKTMLDKEETIDLKIQIDKFSDSLVSDDVKEKWILEHLCIDFMNVWDKCYKCPDTEKDRQELDDIYNKMYIQIFGVKNENDIRNN